MPRNSFILWLALHSHLQTKDRWFNWKLTDSEVCVLYVIVRRRTLAICLSLVIFSKGVWMEVLKAINVHGEPPGQRKKVSWFQRKVDSKSLLSRMRTIAFVLCLYDLGSKERFEFSTTTF